MANPTDELIAGAEAYIAALPDSDFDALVARTREPTDKPVTPEPADEAAGGYPSDWAPGRKARR